MSRPIQLRPLADDEGAVLLQTIRKGRDAIARKRAACVLSAAHGQAPCPRPTRGLTAHATCCRLTIFRPISSGACSVRTSVGARCWPFSRACAAAIRRRSGSSLSWTTAAATRSKRCWTGCGCTTCGSCSRPPNCSWLNPIECHFTALKKFALSGRYFADHQAQGKAIQDYLRHRDLRVNLQSDGIRTTTRERCACHN